MRSGDKTHEHASQLVVVPTLGPGPELTEVPGLAFSAALTPLLLYNLGKCLFRCSLQLLRQELIGGFSFLLPIYKDVP